MSDHDYALAWRGGWRRKRGILVPTGPRPVEKVQPQLRPDVPALVIDKCGTRAGYRQHKRAGNPACDACLAANAENVREWLSHKPIEHGTRHGYTVHKARGEDACTACLRANAEHQRLLRALKNRRAA